MLNKISKIKSSIDLSEGPIHDGNGEVHMDHFREGDPIEWEKLIGLYKKSQYYHYSLFTDIC